MKEGPLGRREQERKRERVILRAAIEELALSDYGGMTVEQVAARAGVNKTTIYRKWENKAELMRAALFSVFETYRAGPTAGDLRSDLLRIAHNIVDFIHSFEGRCLMRLGLLQRPEPELAKIAKDLNERRLVDLSALIQSAVARGEMAPDVDIILLLDMLWGVVHVRVVMKNERVDGPVLERMVDLLMRAAAAQSQPQPKPARKRALKPKQR